MVKVLIVNNQLGKCNYVASRQEANWQQAIGNWQKRAQVEES